MHFLWYLNQHIGCDNKCVLIIGMYSSVINTGIQKSGFVILCED